MCLLIVLGSWSVSLTIEPIAPMPIDQEQASSASEKMSEGDVDVQVLHVSYGVLIKTADSLLSSITTNTGNITTGTQANISTTSNLQGSGAVVTVIASGNTTITGINVTTSGTGYVVGEKITISNSSINADVNVVITLESDDLDGDRWVYDGFFDVAEMITNAGVETDAAALTGELAMWVDDIRTITSSNGVDTAEDHSTVAYRIKSKGQFITENVTLTGTLGDITIDYDATDLVRASDLATYNTVTHMHVKFWITATSFIDVADVTTTHTYYEPVEVYDFPLRVGERWTNDFIDVETWGGSSNFFTIPSDETLNIETNHSVVSVGNPNVPYSGCGSSYNVSTFDENNSVSEFRWWCPAAKGDAWRHYRDGMGIYVDFILKDFLPALAIDRFDMEIDRRDMEVELEYPTWALNMQLGVWVNVTDSNGSPVAGYPFVLRYEYENLWIELTTDSAGVAYYYLNTSDPVDDSPSNHDYASHGIIAYDPVNDYVGVDTLTLDNELVDLDYRPRPGGISVSRDRGNDSMTLNPVYGFNAIPGDVLHFTIPIENKGTNGGPQTELEMVAPDSTTERRTISALPPVGEDSLSFSWMVPTSQTLGNVDFTFEVDPDGQMTNDVNQSNDMATFGIFIGSIPVVGLAVVEPTTTSTEVLLDGTSSSDADGGTLHCTFRVEVDENKFKTFEEPDCLMLVNWTDDGIFQIELTISDEENDNDQTSMTIEILNRPGWINITSPETGILSETSITFSAFDSGDQDTLDENAPLSLLWDPPTRSDGVAYVCDEGPITMLCTVTPVEEGEFLMEVHGTDDDGAVTTAQFPLQVGNIAPRAPTMSLTGGTADNTEPAPAIWQVDEDQQVTLIANGVDTMNDQNSLTWNWNPSSNNNATWAESTVGGNSEIEVLWTESGSHTINLQIVDDDGLTSDMILGYVMVNNVPPTSEPFTAQFPVGEDRLFELTGFFSDTPSDVEGLQVCWDIDLENDADDNLVNNDDCDYIGDSISHSWPEAGVYTIRFHVTDDDGDVAESLVDVNVVNLRPKAALEAEKTTVVVGEEVVIWTTDTNDTVSDLSLLMFSWDLDTDTDSNGDGDPANDMDTFTSRTSPLRHTFDTPGEKHIRLTVTDEDQSSTKDITIYVTEEKSGFFGMMGETAGFSNLLIVLIIVVGAILAVGITMAKKGGEDEIGLFGGDSSPEGSAQSDFAELEEE
jgi:hypothetical protein